MPTKNASLAPLRAKPPLKWAGGKTQILQELQKHFPARCETYYEPFLGGGAVFLSLAQDNRCMGASINDHNKELMDVWRVIRDFPTEIVEELRTMRNTPEEFERRRKLVPDELPPVERAARTIYLNKTAFNGLYRVNKKGRFNAPFGDYPKPNLCNERNIRLVSDLLSRMPVMIRHGDFVDACKNAREGDLAYFDPPYLPTSATSNFTAYTSSGFGYADHLRLASLIKSLVGKGVFCVASNAGTDLARNLYEGFEIHEIQARRNINSKGDKRGPVPEIIVVGRP